MFQAFFLALGQLFDRRVAWVFLKSLALTLLLLAALGVGIWFGMHRLTSAIAGWLGGSEWAGGAADIATIVVVLFAHLVLWRAVAIAVIGIFADEVVEAVEAKHYPQAHAQVRHVPLARSIKMGLGSGQRAVFLNLVFSPVYLIANVAAPFVFFAVNAWLLGRDFGDMVAVRHMPVDELPRWRRSNRFRRLTLGAIGTALLLVPIVNLLAPVIGAAMAAHLFHQRMRK
jgi:CysZ protein